jgi:hypothetical protein
VGDDKVSWGVFYKSGAGVYSRWNQLTVPEDTLRPHCKMDKEGSCVTIIAIAVNFDTREMLMSVNGGDVVVAFSPFDASSALVPAFSCQGARCLRYIPRC